MHHPTSLLLLRKRDCFHWLNMRARGRLWLQRYKTRRQLHSLLLSDPERLQEDLGLSTETALAETNKFFWQR